MEDKSTPPLETPRVLTRNVVNYLTHGLDASDVLECYALVRSAPLHGIASSAITVQKMTIGIRFRPTVADLKNPYNVKTPMELTLEYGPARLGPLLSDEATPIVQGNDDSSFYLAWDNAGKVYFTQKIVTENFLSSQYMASMTGAVLNKLLTEAVEYTERRKVYQPFAIFSDNDQLLLRSSSSSDFTWFVWSHLAKLGVDIEPILPPAMYEARLYTKSVTKVFPDQSVTRAAATFYQRLYSCLESIATNNYGSFLSSKEQSTIDDDDISSSTSMPTSTTISTTTSTGTASPSGKDGDDRDLLIESDDFNDQESSRRHIVFGKNRRRLEEEVQELEELEDMDVEKNEDVDAQITQVPENVEEETSGAEEEIIVKNSRAHDEQATIIPEDVSQSPSNSSQTVSDDSISQDIIPITSQITRDSPTGRPTSGGSETVSPTDGIQDVEKAQNAANDAQKAADEAKIAAHTEGETKAADAAQAAADAALVAADATSSAASQAAMDSLLSGDGTMMSSIIATCFTNPTYEISSPDANRTTPTEIYLFRDPSTYYKLELTSPYLKFAKLNRPLPNAAALHLNYGTGGNALDWTLAISIFFSLFLMVLLICQQMGNNYVEIIYKCQRRVFNPRNLDHNGDSVTGGQSGSHFVFGKSGIPLSMGGRRSSYSPLKNGQTLQKLMVNESFTDDDFDCDGADQDLRPLSSNHLQGSHQQPTHLLSSRELEMISFESDAHAHHRRRTSRTSSYRDNSESSAGSSEDDEDPLDVPDRWLRNPDLVELHSLKSKSKVAIPVGSSANGSVPYNASSSFGEGSANSMNLDQNTF